MEMKPCPRCKGADFFNVPDSLAFACSGCGFVWVLCGDDLDDVHPGATIGQWLNDVFGVPNTMDEKWENDVPETKE